MMVGGNREVGGGGVGVDGEKRGIAAFVQMTVIPCLLKDAIFVR